VGPQWLVNAYDYNADSGFQAPPHRLPTDVVEELVSSSSLSVRVSFFGGEGVMPRGVKRKLTVEIE